MAIAHVVDRAQHFLGQAEVAEQNAGRLRRCPRNDGDQRRLVAVLLLAVTGVVLAVARARAVIGVLAFTGGLDGAVAVIGGLDAARIAAAVFGLVVAALPAGTTTRDVDSVPMFGRGLVRGHVGDVGCGGFRRGTGFRFGASLLFRTWGFRRGRFRHRTACLSGDCVRNDVFRNDVVRDDAGRNGRLRVDWFP